jgi:hypothetical protein
VKSKVFVVVGVGCDLLWGLVFARCAGCFAVVFSDFGASFAKESLWSASIRRSKTRIGSRQRWTGWRACWVLSSSSSSSSPRFSGCFSSPPKEIYDTAGQEEFSSLRDTYIKGAFAGKKGERKRLFCSLCVGSASEGFLLVYSVTSARTFHHAQKLLTHIQKMKSANIPVRAQKKRKRVKVMVRDHKVVLVGNKADMGDQREVTTAEGSRCVLGVVLWF